MSILDDITELAKRRGFFWPAFTLYGGYSGFYDYGPLGVLLKERLIKKWTDAYKKLGGIWVETPVLTPESVFRSSGHLEKFSDAACECSKCGSRYKMESLGIPLEKIRDLVSGKDKGTIKCPNCGSEISKFFDFNLMFRFQSKEEKGQDLYLRPETAQGPMIDFPLLLNFNRGKLPMLVVQLGKSFRNEIAPRQGFMRLRELTLLELEAYLPPVEHELPFKYSDRSFNFFPSSRDAREMKLSGLESGGLLTDPAMLYFISICGTLIEESGIPHDRLRFRQHNDDERAHYSKDSWDAEVKIDETWVEVEGIANRGTYDLSRHSEFSGTQMVAEVDGNKIIPRIVEPALGVDRLVLAILANSLTKRENGNKLLSLPADIAPVTVAIFPLQSKDDLDAIALDLFTRCRDLDPYCTYDSSGSIGRRYARQDEIGTPLCITVDYQTKEDRTVTVRFRDDASQIRVLIDDILAEKSAFDVKAVKEKLNGSTRP